MLLLRGTEKVFISETQSNRLPASLSSSVFRRFCWFAALLWSPGCHLNIAKYRRIAIDSIDLLDTVKHKNEVLSSALPVQMWSPEKFYKFSNKIFSKLFSKLLVKRTLIDRHWESLNRLANRRLSSTALWKLMNSRVTIDSNLPQW